MHLCIVSGLSLGLRGKTIAQADCLRVGEMPNPPGGRGQKSIFARPGFVKYAKGNGVLHAVVPPALDLCCSSPRTGGLPS